MHTNRFRLSLVIGITALVVLAAGCQSLPSSWGPEVGKKIDASLESAKTSDRAAGGAQQVPENVRKALVPPLQIKLPQGGSAPLQEHFDLVVNDVPVRQVFMGLVQGTDYSMVIAPDVTGTVSLNLKNVTIDDALDTLRDVYGYEYERHGNRYIILSPHMQTRMYQVNYLNLVRNGQSDTRVNSSDLSEAVAASQNNGTTTGTTTSTTGSTQGNRLRTPSIQVKTKSDADFWKDLSSSLKDLIGTKDGRRVVVNPEAGLVVVRAMPREQRMVEQYLNATGANLTRQVIIEAKILEVSLDDGFQSGINWSRLYPNLGAQHDTNVTLGQVGGGTVLDTGKSAIAGNTGVLDPSNPSSIVGTAASAFGGVFTMAISAPTFGAFVELLQTQGNVHVLSSPRVATLNNQKAVIKVGADQFFITGITGSGTTAVAGTTTTTIPSVELTPLFSGIALDVTPQIDDSGDIILHIHPTVSEVTEQNQKFVVGSQDFNLPLALSSIRESDSIVRAVSGQIIVIGGLMKEGSTGQDAAVPLLGDIPIVGNLFKHKKVSRIKRELVILLRPTVVESPHTWASAIQESQDRIKHYKRGFFQ